MTGRERDLLDFAVRRGVSGFDDGLGVSIIDNYFLRERKENMLSEGILEVDEFPGRSEGERALLRNQLLLEELEDVRTTRYTNIYDGGSIEKEIAMADKAAQKKIPMGFVDPVKLRDVRLKDFDISQFQGKDGIWRTSLKKASNPDVSFLIGARNDGKGTYLLTSVKELVTEEKAPSKKKALEI